MKRLILLATTVSVIGLGHSALANEQPPALPEDAPLASTVPNSVIDGVEVPYNVLMAVQMDHQGYAVTKASKHTRSGEVAYVLQVSRDTLALPHESIFLLFNKDWQPMGQQAAPPPPPPPAPKPAAPQPAAPAAPAPAPAPAAAPEGGRGGDQDQDNDDDDEYQEESQPRNINRGGRGGGNGGGDD